MGISPTTGTSLLGENSLYRNCKLGHLNGKTVDYIDLLALFAVHLHLTIGQAIIKPSGF
jgi:hypothetical protein